ncbi:hypothetical protein [Alkalicoccus luteus]|uniref:DUF3221 domain-containing protein n=1 Tax=Alkalicoccus luteus TaxID=1237094 RepID=A0A969PP68_9BACI|nr:hypothetical protein [Alkalicoccus luteus]NJP37826.1 hypothetical protein [Alkalicoccus luteus]
MIRMAAVILLFNSLLLPGCMQTSVPDDHPHLFGTVVDHQHSHGRIQIRTDRDESEQQLIWLIEHLDSVIVASDEQPVTVSSVRRGMEVEVWVMDPESMEEQRRAVIDTMVVYETN